MSSCGPYTCVFGLVVGTFGRPAGVAVMLGRRADVFWKDGGDCRRPVRQAGGRKAISLMQIDGIRVGAVDS